MYIYLWPLWPSETGQTRVYIKVRTLLKKYGPEGNGNVLAWAEEEQV